MAEGSGLKAAVLRAKEVFFRSLYRLNKDDDMKKILIAEDERDIRDLISFTLKFAGYEVVAVVNGEEAVKTAQTDRPDLIIMDGRMPKMSGYEACEKIKQMDETKDIPVVFLSAKGQESEIQAGLKAGALEYLLKPFAPDELIKRVQTIFDQLDHPSSES
jgi:CheY-like chemotaxis protein